MKKSVYIEEKLDQSKPIEWSKELFDFTPCKNFPSNEELRGELAEQDRDILEQ